MRARYVGPLLPIATATTDPECTYPWGKTHPKRVRFNHPKSGRSWPFAKRTAPSLRTTSSLNIEYVLMIFWSTVPPASTASVLGRPQALRFCAQICYRAARPATVLAENPPARHTEFSLGTNEPCSRRRGVRLQVDYGKDATALAYLWQVRPGVRLAIGTGNVCATTEGCREFRL